MNSIRQQSDPPQRDITWERARAIFNDPQPPAHVWQKQFDYMDEELQRIARTPYDQFDFSDLWYYHNDMAYVELQPELFAYLFPVCLMDWHETLMHNWECSHGDSEFHHGIHNGKVFEKMVTPDQLLQIALFFRDSLLARMDAEPPLGQSKVRSFYHEECWLFRFNSLGIIAPCIDLVWKAWWSCQTEGVARTIVTYCSLLMYFDWENPLYPGVRPPPMWLDDSQIFDSGWMAENVRFLESVLNADFLHDRLKAAVAMLSNSSDQEVASRVLQDWPRCQELVTARIQELPRLLLTENGVGELEWTV